MILKGNIRAGGSELATHLLNATKNELVELAEVTGFATEDLHGAFAEAHAVSTGTNCTKYLYSLSINPSTEMTREQYGQAIDRIGEKLGLEGQPRAVVFHRKAGRDHAHVVWSRIDVEKMQARHMEFDHQKLREVARELVREFGHEMPKHLGQDRGADRHKDKFNAVTLAEQGQAERSGISPEQRREAVTEAYQLSDNAGAFRHALQERGYLLAQGDRRGLVVLDKAGEVHSLTRQIDGTTAKEIRSKLNPTAIKDLPTVQQAKEQIATLARQDALEATQERPDTSSRVDVAQDALTALAEAQRAELKAIKGNHADDLASLRKEQKERTKHTREAIKKTYRPEWTELFRRQREEMKIVTTLKKSPVKRLKYILAHSDMDKMLDGAKGHLSKSFNWLVKTKPKDRIASLRQQVFPNEIKADTKNMFAFVMKGEFDYKNLEKRHQKEARNLSDMQKLAEREEIKAIKQEVATKRTNARTDHKATLGEVKTQHDDELTDAVKALDTARQITEREGRDLSRGEVATRDRSARGWGGGFARQGFNRQGFDKAQGRDREDDDDERPLKPPGQSFTP